MADNLQYAYNTNWTPDPIYGGWLAGQRDNEAELSRLQNLYTAMQEMQQRQQDYEQKAQMNPLEIQSRQLANQTAQQNMDLNKSKVALVNAQMADPTWAGLQVGSENQKNITGIAKGKADASEANEDSVISAIDQITSGMQNGKLGSLSSLEGVPPEIKSVLMEAMQSPNAPQQLAMLRNGLMQRKAERYYNKVKLQTEAELASREKIAAGHDATSLQNTRMHIAAQQSADAANANKEGNQKTLEHRYNVKRDMWEQAGRPASGPLYDSMVDAWKGLSDLRNISQRPSAVIGADEPGVEFNPARPMPSTPPGVAPKEPAIGKPSREEMIKFLKSQGR